MSHEVKLDVFEGPIELLLHLITRRRVDIYDVSLASITDEYLTAMAAMRGLDLESATGFLVVAATLVELKSARLLPTPGDDVEGGGLEERDLLLARLVECATYREAGAWFRSRLAAGELFFERSVSMEDRYVGLLPDLLANVSAERLATAAAEVLAPKPQVHLDISHLEPIRASVRDAVAEIAVHVEATGAESFERLCAGRSRIDVVVRFLALLELFKAGAVELDQHAPYGDIRIQWTGETSAGEVVVDADEYELELAGGSAMSVPPRKIVEAILLLADDPVPARQMGEVLELPAGEVEDLLRSLQEDLACADRGFVLREVAGGWRLFSSPDCAPWLERFVLRHSHGRLTAAALEVLAILAYRGPLSRAQIAEIRGVDSDGVVKTLIHRGYVDENGRGPGPGAPILLRVTRGFLERIDVKSVDDLPPLRDFMPDAEAVEEMEARLSSGA